MCMEGYNQCGAKFLYARMVLKTVIFLLHISLELNIFILIVYKTLKKLSMAMLKIVWDEY